MTLPPYVLQWSEGGEGAASAQAKLFHGFLMQPSQQRYKIGTIIFILQV